MRNMVQYPLTIEEILCAVKAAGEVDDDEIGSLNPLIFEHVFKIVKAASAMIDGIDSRMADNPLGDPMRWITPWKEATDLVKAFEGVNR